MDKFMFKKTSIELYDDYMIINKNSFLNEPVKLSKEEILSISFTKSEFTNRVRTGNSGFSMRVAKGMYYRRSTPCYSNVKTYWFNPIITLKNNEIIYLESVMEYEKLDTMYQNNINSISMWLNSRSLVDYHTSLKKYNDEKATQETHTGIICFMWFALFIYSIFSGSFSFFVFMLMLPATALITYAFVIALKQKSWLMAIITFILDFSILIFYLDSFNK